MRIPICLLALVSLSFAVYAEDPDDQTPAPATQGTPTQPAAAPAPATPPAPPPKYDGWVFSGLLDGYITDNTNHPMANNGYDQLQNFNIINGQPEFSLGKFTVDKSDGVFGIHVDAGLGETMRLIHAGDPAAEDHKALRYIEQAYLIAKPKNMHGTEIDFGTFVTSAGAEVIEAPSNWNYSRSLLFAWAIPYYHFGLKTTTPINKVVTIGFQLVNPWNETWGAHKFSNVGVTLAVTKGIYTWNTNYYVGENNPVIGTLPSGGVRNLFDTTLTVAPNDKTSFYINGDYGRNDNPVGGGHTDWEGIAVAARYQVTKAAAFAARTEFFKDAQGYETGVAQNLGEFTLTGEYKFGSILLSRVELRRDESSVPFFNTATKLGGAEGQTTLTLGLMAVFGPYK
jgi:hypothetical protein